MNVRLIWVTEQAEKVIGYCARVSNPANQDNEDVGKLIKYCVSKGHWSIFETANMCLEVETSRAVSAQLLRHRSFSFQEFSQRYAVANSYEDVELRRQDPKNRQNSIVDRELHGYWATTVDSFIEQALHLYDAMVSSGVAKECARMVLPMATRTRLYMNGTIRSWIHYLQVRALGEGTQDEHRQVALAALSIFVDQLPITAAALGFS